MIKTDLYELKKVVEGKCPSDSHVVLSLTKEGDNLYHLRFSMISYQDMWEWNGSHVNEETLIASFLDFFQDKITTWWNTRFNP